MFLTFYDIQERHMRDSSPTSDYQEDKENLFPSKVPQLGKAKVSISRPITIPCKPFVGRDKPGGLFLSRFIFW